MKAAITPVLSLIFSLVSGLFLGFGLDYHGTTGWQMPTGMAVCFITGTLVLAAARIMAEKKYLFGFVFTCFGLVFAVVFGSYKGIGVPTLIEAMYVPGPWWLWAAMFILGWYLVILTLALIGDESKQNNARINILRPHSDRM